MAAPAPAQIQSTRRPACTAKATANGDTAPRPRIHSGNRPAASATAVWTAPSGKATAPARSRRWISPYAIQLNALHATRAATGTDSARRLFQALRRTASTTNAGKSTRLVYLIRHPAAANAHACQSRSCPPSRPASAMQRKKPAQMASVGTSTIRLSPGRNAGPSASSAVTHSACAGTSSPASLQTNQSARNANATETRWSASAGAPSFIGTASRYMNRWGTLSACSGSATWSQLSIALAACTGSRTMACAIQRCAVSSMWTALVTVNAPATAASPATAVRPRARLAGIRFGGHRHRLDFLSPAPQQAALAEQGLALEGQHEHSPHEPWHHLRQVVEEHEGEGRLLGDPEGDQRQRPARLERPSVSRRGNGGGDVERRQGRELLHGGEI